MAVFDPDGSDWGRLDWRLLQSGSVALYFRREVLDNDVSWLREHGYTIKILDCLTWTDARAMHAALASALSFPDYYGRNLAALNDCLSDLDVPAEGGLVLILDRFDAFATRDRPVAEAVLDIVANNARVFLLFGRRLLTLVQSDDPHITFEPVGATPVLWNPAEWLNKSRGI